MEKLKTLLRTILDSNKIANELNSIKLPLLLSEIEQLKILNGKIDITKFKSE